MKKTIILSLLLIAAFIGNAQKEDFTGIRIFVNPGHGGLDSDDRHMIETDFWESEGNLAKGLYLRTLLQNKKATVYMSRTTNTTADDLPLSTISTMANDANVDFFLSIHSNGFDGKSNRALVLFRGYDDQPVYPASKTFASSLFTKLLEKGDYWTSTSTWVKGDWSFYPDWIPKGLGVLRELTMPGVLSEGSYHDYVAEGWRLKNNDHLLSESWAFFRTFTSHFGVNPETDGMISGVVRNPLKTPTYYFGATTTDKDIPLNGGLVTLTPSNKTYRIDNKNNGYFQFDSVPAGNYKITISEIPNFYQKEIDVVVESNKNKYINVLAKQDTTIVPNLLSITPDNKDSLSLNPQFVLKFDLAMDTKKVAAALSITPAVEMEFVWTEKNTVLTVKPKVTLAPKTNYQLTLSTAATSQWGVAIPVGFDKTYTTFNHTELILNANYPTHNQANLSPYLQVRLQFNAPLKPETVDANIELVNSENIPVSIKLKEFYTINGKGYYYFEPNAGLALNTQYTLRLKTGLQDSYGETLHQAKEINFTTRSKAYEQGTVIETCDAVANFWDPNASGSTVGTNDQATTVALSTTRKMFGTGAIKLNYQFTGASGGVCRVHNPAKPVVGGATTAHVGAWFFGDNSNNSLEYWFYYSYPNNKILPISRINWTGWEFKSIPKSSIAGTGTLQFHSIIIKQESGAALSGEVYFDNYQYFEPAINTDVEEISNSAFNASVYPNPTDSRALIQFNLNEVADVTISIYNLMGQKIETVYQANAIVGEHITQWIPEQNTPTGIYFVKIEATDSKTTLKTTQNIKIVKQ